MAGFSGAFGVPAESGLSLRGVQQDPKYAQSMEIIKGKYAFYLPRPIPGSISRSYESAIGMPSYTALSENSVELASYSPFHCFEEVKFLRSRFNEYFRAESIFKNTIMRIVSSSERMIGVSFKPIKKEFAQTLMFRKCDCGGDALKVFLSLFSTNQQPVRVYGDINQHIGYLEQPDISLYLSLSGILFNFLEDGAAADTSTESIAVSYKSLDGQEQLKVFTKWIPV